MSPIIAVDDMCVRLAERFIDRLELDPDAEGHKRKRELMVDELATLLQAVGEDAIASYRVSPPKG